MKFCSEILLAFVICVVTLVHAGRGESPKAGNPIGDLVGNLGKSVGRLVQGVKATPNQVRTVNLLRKRMRDGGPNSLSYSDFKYIETSKDDLWKAIRLALTASVSAEFFFYSYLAAPALSPNNPWSWITLPSVFDSEEDKQARNKIKMQRRQNTVLKSVSAIMGETADDIPAKLRESRLSQSKKLKESLRLVGKSMEAALEPLAPFYTAGGSTKEEKRKSASRMISQKKKGGESKVEMCLDGVPWGSVKDTCRSFGFDGVPNIFVLRRLNKGEIYRHFDNIRKADDHLKLIGVDRLADSEVVEACFERCIAIDNTRSLGDMRRDLREWLDLVENPPTIKKNFNDQNVRLAMAGLHTVRTLRKSRFSSPAQALLRD